MRGSRDVWHYVGALLVALIIAQLVYLVVLRTDDDASSVAVDDTGTPAAPGESATPAATPDADPTEADVPKVPDQRRVDFSRGDDLPDGGVLVDLGGNADPLALGDDGLTHGAPGDGGGAGYLETRLKSDVRALGVRVRFAESDSGAVALVAWQTSLDEATSEGDGADLPPTGLRLVATPGSWVLSTLSDGEEEVLANGSYDAPAGDPATFELVRGEDAVYVIDPAGTITQGASQLVSRLTGPWASWGLVEASAEETPAVIESVWAG